MRAIAITWTNGKTYYFRDPMWTESQADEALTQVQRMFEHNSAQWQFGEEPEAWMIDLHFPEPILSPQLMAAFVREREGDVHGVNSS